jgi:hypothetical protein
LLSNILSPFPLLDLSTLNTSLSENHPSSTVKMPETVGENGQAAPGRLLLLSNRLPITIKRSEDGSYSFSMSSGGLVTGLSGLSKTTSFQWYGWPGLEVPDNEVEGMKQRLKEEYGAHPVFIDDELADRHYNGFSSKHTYVETRSILYLTTSF